MFKNLDLKTVIEFNPVVVGLFHSPIVVGGGGKKAPT